MPLGRGRAHLASASRFTRATLDAVAQRARGILPTLLETSRDAPVASSTASARRDAAAGERPTDDSMRSSEAPRASTSRPTTENLPREFRFELPRVKGATTEVEDATHECARTPPGRDAKRGGFAFFESMGAPRFHVAPMVDQSELAFRELCRRYGATLGYTPMIHARLFVESPKYRREVFSTSSSDRPLLAQFCANDPDVLLQAATMIAPYCDGVDINFGCPQRIAKRGNYGAFLMDDWKTVEALIRKLDEELPVPVTAKIRVYDDLETTLKYAKMVEAAGAQIVAVHGRTREQKRCADIRANWPYIKAIKEALKVPVLANGDIRSLAEARACLEATGADGVLSAEPLLSNPALFSDPPAFPPPSDGHAPIPLDGVGGVDLMIEYFDICRAYSTPFSYIRGHVWKLVGHWMSEFTDLRDEFVVFRHPADLDGLTAWGEKMRARILEVERTTGRRRPVPKKSERALAREAAEEAKRAAMDEAKREEDALREIDAMKENVETDGDPDGKRQKVDDDDARARA